MSQENLYRNLSGREIDGLISNGCSCKDWNRIKVLKGFDPSQCRNVIFSGDIFLGAFTKPFTDSSGVTIPSGISNARLHNCTVGSNVLINNIGVYIANYNIEEEVVIINCGKIYTEGTSKFGNGTTVAVLNENGGRKVKIHNNLSSHEAYIVALYRHRTKAIRIIDKLIDKYSDSIASDMGTIGRNSQIINCANMGNVRIGPYSHIDGPLRLNDGTINSSKEAPVFIGPGVIMDHFIVCSGSVVTESAIIENCFIGQGCVLEKGFSAKNSLFFANCEGSHGEACSVFAGPYTVTHHKSTLLIAGLFSFMNAGSGSNQSNHMYKLGPVHEGIIGRGSKTTSDSYIKWPSSIGPFSLVIGQHQKNLDTSALPFSYLIGREDESIVIPALNLLSVGTVRDAKKWPQRDRRKDANKTDQINFDILSPYTVLKMANGRDFLKKVKSETKAVSSYYSCGNIKIKETALDRGIDLYQKGIDKFVGNSIIRRIENRKIDSNRELQKVLQPDNPSGKGEWVDLAGLIAPLESVNSILDDIESGKINSLGQFNKTFPEMHGSYCDYAWTWTCERIKDETGKGINKLTAEDVILIIERWKKSLVDLDEMLYKDAEKEFISSAMTGYGIDGDEKIKKLDFKQVHGEFESNEIVKDIKYHIKQKSILGNELIRQMKLINK